MSLSKPSDSNSSCFKTLTLKVKYDFSAIILVNLECKFLLCVCVFILKRNDVLDM